MNDQYHDFTLTRSPPKVTVSSCLLGENVRYDGHNKRNNIIIGTLAENLDVLPVCPEMGIGLGVPRPPIQLVQYINKIRAVGVLDKSHDVTLQLEQYATRFLDRHPDLCGAILTSKSPSCGLNSTKLYTQEGTLLNQQVSGIFVQKISDTHPGLPIVNDDNLVSTQSRVVFILRVYAYARLMQAINAENSAVALYELHLCYFPLVLSMSETKTMMLDKIIREIMIEFTQERLNRYRLLFGQIMQLSIHRHHLADFVSMTIKQQMGMGNTGSMEPISDALQHYSKGQYEWSALLASLEGITGNIDKRREKAFIAGHWLVPVTG